VGSGGEALADGLGTIHPIAVFENAYFTFFSDFKKHDFLLFLKWRFKKT